MKIANKFIQINKEQELTPEIHNLTMLCAGAAAVIPYYGHKYKSLLNTCFAVIMNDKDGIAFFSRTNFKALAMEVFEDSWKNPVFIKKRWEEFNKIEQKIEKIYSKVSYYYVSKREIDDLLKDVKECVTLSRTLNAWSWFSVIFDQEMCLELINKLKIKISKERLDEIWYKSAAPAFASFDKRRHMEVLKLISKGTRWKELVERCQYHNANYNKIFNFNETSKELKDKYGNLTKQNASNLLKEELEEFKNKELEYGSWLRTLTKDEKKLVTYLQEIIRFRDYRKDPISQSLTIHFRVAQRMFKEANIPEKYVYYYTYEELIKGIDYLIKVKDKLIKRPNGFVLLYNLDGTVEFEYGTFEETRDKIKDFFFKKIESTREIKGQTACKGKATGEVKIIRNPSKAQHFREGDILVTGMTRPEFVPLMKKAAAIVTDEGGITCHAAVVSRELNIPCIIGTRIASTVLRDGDVIEVDANRGVIRILENNIDLSYFDNFSFQASRPQTIQRDEMVNTMYKKYSNYGMRVIVTPLEGAQRAWWIDSKAENILYEYLLKIISTEQGFKKILKEYGHFKVKFAKLSKEFEKKNLSKSELLELFKRFYDECEPYADHVWVMYPIERIMDKQFLHELQAKYPGKSEGMYEAISNPTKLVEYQDMRTEICKAVIGKKNFKIVAKELEDKYSWNSEYSYVEPPLDRMYFMKELEKLSLDEARNELERLSEIEGKNKKAFDSVLKEIKDKKLNLQARVINEYVYIRTDRIDIVKKVMYKFRDILNQIAVCLKKDTNEAWTRNDVAELLNSEIEGYLLGKLVPNLREIRDRVRHYVYVSDKDGIRLITDENNVKSIARYLAESKNKDDIIKGKVAYKGLVQGKAVIVFSKNDLSKVTKDSVLIARTTMVEYTPAMERAKAIVTAEGGITSHAAIVSRELKKPCIVGTRNCMDLIKNGDLIEVDANNGIVRKL